VGFVVGFDWCTGIGTDFGGGEFEGAIVIGIAGLGWKFLIVRESGGTLMGIVLFACGRRHRLLFTINSTDPSPQ
jgi:hypothetical protein